MSVRRLGLLLMCAAALGCETGYRAKADVERTVPVSGTLTFQGKPLEFFQVSVHPTDGSRVATGLADAEGKFVLGTNKLGDGAPPGKAKIAVTFVGPPSAEIPGQEAIIDDPSKLPKPTVKLPAKYGNPETSGLDQEIPQNGLTDWKLDLQ